MPEHLCYAECLWAGEPWTDIDERPRVSCYFNAPGGLAPSVVARMGILGAPCPFAEALEAEARRRDMVTRKEVAAEVEALADQAAEGMGLAAGFAVAALRRAATMLRGDDS